MEQHKKCSKCKEVKPVTEFHKESRAKNGYKPRCKECCKEDMALFFARHPGYAAKRMSLSYPKHRDKILERSREYGKKNKEKKAAYNKEYQVVNRDRLTKQSAALTSRRRKEDLGFRLKLCYRKLVDRFGIGVDGSVEAMVGYSFDELVTTLGRLPELHESLDHKVPVSWFKKDTPLRIIHNLQNLQIKTRSENSKKHNCFHDTIPSEYFFLIQKHIKERFINRLQNGN